MFNSYSVYRFKITLNDSSPTVWRRFLVRSDISFFDLHSIIQIIMDWDNDHLYKFEFKNLAEVFPTQYEFYESSAYDVEDTRIDSLFSQRKSCKYIYDFGDYWEHTIKLEKILPPDDSQSLPLCIAGEHPSPQQYPSEAIISKHSTHSNSIDRITTDDNSSALPHSGFDIDAVNEQLAVLSLTQSSDIIYTPPSVEQWKAIFELAIKIRDSKPWETLSTNDHVVVSLPGSNNHIYFLTMGGLGCSIAFSVYQSAEALYALEHAQCESLDISSIVKFAGLQDCITCFFADRDELTEEDLDILNSVNLKFRGKGKWIFFRSFKPGYAPWFLSASEAELLINTLPAYIDAYKKIALGIETPINEHSILQSFDPRSNSWASAWIPNSSLAVDYSDGDYIIISDDLYLARLKRHPKSPYEIELDTVYIPVPVQDNKSSRPYLPRLVLLMDNGDDFVTAQKTLMPHEDISFAYYDILEELVTHYGIPRVLHVRGKKNELLLSDWCAKLGVLLRIDPVLPTIDDALMMLDDFIGLSSESDIFDPDFL